MTKPIGLALTIKVIDSDARGSKFFFTDDATGDYVCEDAGRNNNSHGHPSPLEPIIRPFSSIWEN